MQEVNDKQRVYDFDDWIDLSKSIKDTSNVPEQLDWYVFIRKDVKPQFFMSNTLEQTLNNEIIEDTEITSEEKKIIDISDFVWNPPHDFSEIPEQSFKVIAKISKEVSISIKDDGRLKI